MEAFYKGLESKMRKHLDNSFLWEDKASLTNQKGLAGSRKAYLARLVPCIKMKCILLKIYLHVYGATSSFVFHLKGVSFLQHEAASRTENFRVAVVGPSSPGLCVKRAHHTLRVLLSTIEHLSGCALKYRRASERHVHNGFVMQKK